MSTKGFNRRDMLKTGAFFALGAPLLDLLDARRAEALPLVLDQQESPARPSRPITAVVLGAGNRGNVYASYAERFPEELKIVGVAEPIEFRRSRFATRYGIPAERQWVTWEHAFRQLKFADAVIITTPDALHHGPATTGLRFGYDMILEKPIAQNWKHCAEILKLAQQKKRIVAVCHVLRYTAYFRKMKEVLDSGQLGKIVSISHFEPVQHEHMAHSFVRGNWRNSKESNFMLLSKSCHDLDMLRWLVGKPCTSVASYGALTLFKKENAPPGSTKRCTDGCAVEATCPYSALKIYHRNRTYLGHMDLPAEGDKGPAILEHLKTGPYGRCVYHCDNDVVDHQVVAMEFAGQVTAAFSMEAFTGYHGRRTRIMGTMGDLVGDMALMTVTDFRTGKSTTWDASKAIAQESGHGGGDYGLVHDFVRAVDKQDPALLTSTIEASMESHLIAFRAEESRLKARMVPVRMP